MNAADPQAIAQWREALLWLANADSDISGALTLLASGQPDLAAFHVQQALSSPNSTIVALGQHEKATSEDLSP